MARIIALDYGLKRTGIAVTDPFQLIANALQTVPSKDLLAFLKTYFAQEEVEAIVLGLPKNLKNEDTHATEGVRKLEIALKTQFPDKPVHLVDERFTSRMALDAMVAGGMKKKDRREKGNIDKVSAVIILQSYMEARR